MSSMVPKFHPFEVMELCPYCWTAPCNCVDSGRDAIDAACKKCAEKDSEIEKLKNLLALAGVGW